MKVTDIKITMFNWKSDDWFTNPHTRFGGDTLLGIVTVETDAGVSGNAFFGVV